ncbi:transposase, partial [Massilia sp. CFBP 13647]|uniref:IS110 family transposase n=2 Tax=unclassified Massilia TaxID=2609279 RepID=UPI001781B124
MFYLGVDVAKKKLDCMLLDTSSGKTKSKVVPNTLAGFKELLEWLEKNKAINPQVIMEPTGMYHESAALALADAGLVVSLVNPAQLRAFAQGLGIKNKTDKEDSTVLA